MLSDNAMTTVLLCSPLGLDGEGPKPYTSIKWNELAGRIVNSVLHEPSALLKMSCEDLTHVLAISDVEGKRILSLLKRLTAVSFLLEKLKEKGINVCTVNDENYPERLREILKKYAPPVLFYSGELSLANTAGIAIVGSRKSDQKAEVFTRKLSELAADQHFGVFSGGAPGIDSVAEKSVITQGGYALSVVSDSLEKRIMKRENREKISSGHLLILSSQSPQSPFSVWRAMDRNKYIYALSTAAFVVSSGIEKSGTFSGATENMKRGWVQTFVYDTDDYPGNRVLINNGAYPVKNLGDLSIKELLKQHEEVDDQMTLFVDKGSNNHSQPVINLSSDKNKQDFDLYQVVLKTLLSYLTQPKSLDEIKKTLKITQSQALEWLKRAEREQFILKQNHPIRYIVNDKNCH